MSVGCHQSTSQSITCSVTLDQRIEMYETAGDIELISLHRVKNRLPSLKLKPSVRAILAQQLVTANEEYRSETNSNRYCVTANDVDGAITGLEGEIKKGYLQYAGLQDSQAIAADILRTLEKFTGEVGYVARNWFAENYDDLIYDTEANIPWPVIRAMRGRFRNWAAGDGGAFNVPIGEFVEEIARTEGLDPAKYDSYEDVWKELRTHEK